MHFRLPDPEDELIPELDFQEQVEQAWQVCDRFDLQTNIWRGRILRAVRDREKRHGDGRGTGFLNWLKDREISKSQAYSMIELANSADTLLDGGYLEPEDVNQFSKRAFVETAQSGSLKCSKWSAMRRIGAIASLVAKSASFRMTGLP
jgi:hypothetical protein